MSASHPNGDPDREPSSEVRDWPRPWPPVDWDAIEGEALRRGCTVADVVCERAGRRFLDASF